MIVGCYFTGMSECREQTQTIMKKNKKNPGDEKQSFPGYPKYPATEDIVYRAKRVDMDLDGEEPVADRIKDATSPSVVEKNSQAGKRSGHSPADVTKEDLKALNAEENSFEGDDAVLGDRVYPVDFAGKDLDVPGSELDDRDELKGDEDEENNLYSLGGENHEDLEDDRS